MASPGSARYRPLNVGGCLHAVLEDKPGGVLYLRSTEALQPYPQRLTDRLEHWAASVPDRVFAARRRRHGADAGTWEEISYAQMLERARRVGQALVRRGLSAERPVAVLSDNDLEHLTLALGAMWAGVPIVPISPAYSLVSQDHAKLRHVFAVTTPGLVFAADASYARALQAVVGPDVEVVLGTGSLDGRSATSFADLLAERLGAEVDAAHAATGPDTIVKFLFTSGSTLQPKGVINTQRMLCSNQQMLRQAFAFLADEPPVLVDWLPWNHTFGGNHNVGLVLYNGGTLYIDDGKPTPAGMAETLRNLREVSPTLYFNVPKGFEEIARAMDGDAQLRENLFRRVQAFMFAGAGLSQAVWDRLDAHAERTIGMRVRMLTGLGMTETAPSCMFALGAGVRSGHIGLPCPGVEVKLVPLGDKSEVRFRGPNVMPGYWRSPEQTAKAFDEEGFYCTGDAVCFVDPSDPQQGLLFDGRVAEDFKLSTGTFVSVGPLRARIVLEGAPYVHDAVLTGLNRSDLGLLVFPRLDECRRLAGLGPDSGAAEVLHHPVVRSFFQDLLDRLWAQGTGSANRVARAHLLAEPPSIDHGEMTDKGSINQRAVLTRRAALIDAMYEASDPWLLVPRT
jgi:feruloyl-CoA synthase